MNQPIIENESLNIKNLCTFFLNVSKKYLRSSIIIVMIYIVYFFIKSPVYSSSLSFYTNYSSNQSGSISFLQSLSGELDSENLGFSISDFLSSDRFFNQLVNESYLINDETISLVTYFSSDSGRIVSMNPISTLSKISKSIKLAPNLTKEQKAVLFSKEYIEKNMSYSEDRKTQLHKVSFKGKNSDLNDQIIENIFYLILQYSNEVTNVKAKEKKLFIESRLVDIKKDLELAENLKLNFLEKNKIISSPALILQESRIEKNISLYQSLFISMSDQLELAKIDEKDVTSPIVILDKPVNSYYKVGRSIFEGIFLVYFILLTSFCFIEGYKDRKNLFLT
ncbi:hypothetical protein N9C34_00535 [Candidatus Marinimicrobia bacterium]|nr:hypothetical protein [Candidatus Neomarinimicrobiota bacterium]